MMSNLEIISTMQRSACRFLFGVSFSLVSHFSVRSPKARRFHVAIKRLRSGVFGGIWLSRAFRKPTSSACMFAGGLSNSEIAHSSMYC
jgi:hypothetical protein